MLSFCLFICLLKCNQMHLSIIIILCIYIATINYYLYYTLLCFYDLLKFKLYTFSPDLVFSLNQNLYNKFNYETWNFIFIEKLMPYDYFNEVRLKISFPSMCHLCAQYIYAYLCHFIAFGTSNKKKCTFLRDRKGRFLYKYQLIMHIST